MLDQIAWVYMVSVLRVANSGKLLCLTGLAVGADNRKYIDNVYGKC